MITYLETSVFDSPAQTLVNTVNIEGVTGKGIAKEFKGRYPAMYEEYRKLCQRRELDIGKLHLWRSDKRWVLNFPTKTTWRLPSKIEYIEAGLAKFVATYRELGITSISFPPLGCGNGNLNWSDVRPIMDAHLSKILIPVYVHDVQVKEDFVPEHLEPAPEDFGTFWSDVVGVIHRNKGMFYTSQDGAFSALLTAEGDIVVEKAGKRRRIDRDFIEESWLVLRERYLSNQSFPDQNARTLKSYLFPIFSELPYVRKAMVRHPNSQNARAEGLFINRENFGGYVPDRGKDGVQERLFL